MRNILWVLTLFTSSITIGQSPWVIEAKNINPNNYYGITVANGMIGLVSSPNPMQVGDVVLNGVYDRYQRGRVSNILKTFNHMNMTLDIDGRRVDAAQMSGYSQALDMKKAVLKTQFDIGTKATVRTELMALRHLPYTAMQIFEIKAHVDLVATPASVIEAPNHLVQPQSFFAEIDRPHVKIPLMTSVAKSPSGQLTVAASNSFIFDLPHGSEPSLIHEDWDYNRHLTKFHIKLKAGDSFRFAVVGSTLSSAHSPDPQNEAERLTIYAKLEGTKRLLERHMADWEKLWQSDISIPNDPDQTRDLRSALYHLYSFARAGTSYSLSPMGLSGLGYNGHVFWDTELWMYPPLLMLQPELAKSLLEYRFERLAAAKQNAFSHGYAGAMFPWESSLDGTEDTPVWALTGPFQQHISSCISWAFWKYYQVSKDETWLRERAWPVMEAVADFWCSRVERKGPNKYEINNVIGANEWQENIDNNAFTNAMAITVLRYTAQAATILGKKINPDWLHVAENIPIIKFSDGTTRENASYSGEMIKQADVNLLAYPLEFWKEEDPIKKDLAYYESRMAPDGPAMGFAILSILHAQLGNSEKAYQIFLSSYKPNEVPPFGVLAETAGGTNPYFATGAGGMLQAILSGFGGLRITDQGIIQGKKSLPKAWKSLEIRGIGLKKENFVIK